MQAFIRWNKVYLLCVMPGSFLSLLLNGLLDPSCTVVINTGRESGFCPRELMGTVCILVCLWACGESAFCTGVPYTLNRSRRWCNQLETLATGWNVICGSEKFRCLAFRLPACEYEKENMLESNNLRQEYVLGFGLLEDKSLQCGLKKQVFSFPESDYFLVSVPSRAFETLLLKPRTREPSAWP